MTERETVGAAILAVMTDGGIEWAELPRADQELGLQLADAAFASIIHVAAERGWQIRPDEATEEMLNSCPQAQSRNNVGRDRYRALMKAAPKFKLNE